VYTALQALAREGLAKSWVVVPRGRRGARGRRYYELTARGIEVAERQRRALASLVVSRGVAPSEESVRLMRSRLESCAGLSADLRELRDRMREAAK
jgi:DNA-binding PadR family transcriptional regulator